MINIPKWTIWIPLAGIVFYRLRIEQEKDWGPVSFIIAWMVYQVIIGTAFLIFIVLRLDK